MASSLPTVSSSGPDKSSPSSPAIRAPPRWSHSPRRAVRACFSTPTRRTRHGHADDIRKKARSWSGSPRYDADAAARIRAYFPRSHSRSAARIRPAGARPAAAVAGRLGRDQAGQRSARALTRYVLYYAGCRLRGTVMADGTATQAKGPYPFFSIAFRLSKSGSDLRTESSPD